MRGFVNFLVYMPHGLPGSQASPAHSSRTMAFWGLMQKCPSSPSGGLERMLGYKGDLSSQLGASLDCGRFNSGHISSCQETTSAQPFSHNGAGAPPRPRRRS